MGNTSFKEALQRFVPNVNWRVSVFLLIVLGLFYLVSGTTFFGFLGSEKCILDKNVADTLKAVCTILTVAGALMLIIGILLFWQIKDSDHWIYTAMQKGGWLGLSIVLLVPSIILYQKIVTQKCDDKATETGSNHQSLNSLGLTIMSVSVSLFVASGFTTFYFVSETTEEKFIKLKEKMGNMSKLSVQDLEDMFHTYESLELEADFSGQLPSKNDLELAIKDKYTDKIARTIYTDLKSNYSKYDERKVEDLLQKSYKTICEFNEENYHQNIEIPQHPITPEKLITKITEINSKTKEIDESDLKFIKDNLCKAKTVEDINAQIKNLSLQKIADIIKFNREKRQQQVLEDYCEGVEQPNKEDLVDPFGIKAAIRNKNNEAVQSPVIMPINSKCKDFVAKKKLASVIDLTRAEVTEERARSLERKLKNEVKNEEAVSSREDSPPPYSYSNEEVPPHLELDTPPRSPVLSSQPAVSGVKPEQFNLNRFSPINYRMKRHTSLSKLVKKLKSKMKK